MRNRGLTTVTKVYIGVGVFMAVVVAGVVLRIIGANLYPQQNVTREDPTVNDSAATIPRQPAGSSNSETDQNHNNQTPNSPEIPSGEKSGATQ